MIKEILNDFIQCWKAFNRQRVLTNQEAAGKINRGDCGLAAIAVAHVLRVKYQIPAEIYQNPHHCWIRIEGSGEYDTLHPEGYKTPVKEVWDRHDGPSEQHLSFAQACSEWMPCDAFGGYLCKAFFERHGLAMPPELEHCISNAAEYESPEEIPNLVAAYQRAVAGLLAV